MIVDDITFAQFLTNYSFKEFDENYPENQGICCIVVEIPNNPTELSYFKIKFGIEDYSTKALKLCVLEKLFNSNILQMFVKSISNKYGTITITLSNFSEYDDCEE